jgi:hypothetical protein
VIEEELGSQLGRLFDSDLIYHGFTKYTRDYELFVYNSVDPRSGSTSWHDRYFFRMCTEADVRSRVRAEVWATSLDDGLLERHRATRDDEGYVWGVQSQVLYPGATLIEESVRARHWEQEVGVPFHEVLIEANAQTISLVFAELQVARVSPGFVPYEVHGDDFAEQNADRTKVPLNPD